MSEIDIFVSSMSIVTLDHMKNIVLVGNTCHFDVETKFVALTVDGKMAKLHLGPAMVRRLPGRSVPGQRRTENPRWELIKWLLPASLAHHKTSKDSGGQCT